MQIVQDFGAKFAYFKCNSDGTWHLLYESLEPRGGTFTINQTWKITKKHTNFYK